MAESKQVACPHCGQPYTLEAEQIPQYLGQTIVCQQCQREFGVEGSVAEVRTVAMGSDASPPGPAWEGPGPPGGAPVPRQGLNYATPVALKTDGMSIASLASGVVGLIIPVIPAVLAIIFGIMGIGRTKDPLVGGRGLAIAGLILGAAGIAMSTCLVAILVPSLNRAREAAQAVRCASNMRQIGMGILMYAVDYDDQLPPDLGTLVDMGYVPTVDVFVCPASDSASVLDLPVSEQVDWINEEGDYIYVGPVGQRMVDIANRSETILAYERVSHYQGRLGRGMNLLFTDGHVAFHRWDEAIELLEEQGHEVELE